MPHRDEVSYNCMIAVYLKNKDLPRAESLFKAIPQRNIVAESAMIDGYAKAGRLDDARMVFDEMTDRNVFSWTSMLYGYFGCGRPEEGMSLFSEMPEKNVVSWTTVVSGLGRNGLVDQARKFFDMMPEKNAIAWTAMVKSYLDNGCFDEAYELFLEMPERNVCSWNIMISGCFGAKRMDKAIELFQLMLRSCFRPDETTMTSVVTSCDGVVELTQAHSMIIRLGFEHDTRLTNALINLYSKSGDLCSARLAFEPLKSKDVVSWTTMIVAYSNHGHGHRALAVFARMLISGIKPDEVTFIGLLSACSHAGLVNQGRRIFNSIKGTYNLTPKAEHYSCLVDILGRAGLIDEAMDVVSTIPPSERDEAVLVALLGACKLHGDVTIANYVGEKLLEFESSSSGGYILLANTYAAEGKWNEFAKVRKRMRERNVKKIPGYSQIQVNGKNHVFFVGDRFIPKVEEIYGMLQHNLQPLMREMGYTPDKLLLID